MTATFDQQLLTLLGRMIRINSDKFNVKWSGITGFRKCNIDIEFSTTPQYLKFLKGELKSTLAKSTDRKATVYTNTAVETKKLKTILIHGLTKR